MSTTKPLSGQLQAMLGTITDYQREHGFSPSIRDLQERLNVSSSSVVDYRLKCLEARGLIRREPGISRSIRVVSRQEGAAA